MFAVFALLAAILLSGCSTAPRSEKSTSESTAKPLFPLKITQFYSDPAVVRGSAEKVNLCYGVEGAQSVTLDPPVERLWPTPARCFEVKPTATTTYTITAEDGAGGKVSQKTIVQFGPPAAKILEISVNALEIKSGEVFPFCVSAVHVKSWTLSAGQWRTPPTEKGGCALDYPKVTTTYVVTATGAMGETDTERVTVTVK